MATESKIDPISKKIESKIEQIPSKKIESLTSRLNPVATSLADFSKRGQASLREGKEKLVKVTQKNPVAALGIASAVGFLLGFLLTRKK